MFVLESIYIVDGKISFDILKNNILAIPNLIETNFDLTKHWWQMHFNNYALVLILLLMRKLYINHHKSCTMMMAKVYIFSDIMTIIVNKSTDIKRIINKQMNFSMHLFQGSLKKITLQSSYQNKRERGWELFFTISHWFCTKKTSSSYEALKQLGLCNIYFFRHFF